MFQMQLGVTQSSSLCTEPGGRPVGRWFQAFPNQTRSVIKTYVNKNIFLKLYLILFKLCRGDSAVTWWPRRGEDRLSKACRCDISSKPPFIRLVQRWRSRRAGYIKFSSPATWLFQEKQSNMRRQLTLKSNFQYLKLKHLFACTAMPLKCTDDKGSIQYIPRSVADVCV